MFESKFKVDPRRMKSTLLVLVISQIITLLLVAVQQTKGTEIGTLIGQTITNGIFTFYGQPGGRGACGLDLACPTMSAAVSGEFFATGSWVPSPSGHCSDGRYIFSNAVCQGICVKVSYKGKTVTVPVNNECPECTTNWVDLTTAAFTVLAPQSVGKATGATIQYLYCNKTSVPKAVCQCPSSG